MNVKFNDVVVMMTEALAAKNKYGNDLPDFIGKEVKEFVAQMNAINMLDATKLQFNGVLLENIVIPKEFAWIVGPKAISAGTTTEYLDFSTHESFEGAVPAQTWDESDFVKFCTKMSSFFGMKETVTVADVRVIYPISADTVANFGYNGMVPYICSGDRFPWPVKHAFMEKEMYLVPDKAIAKKFITKSLT